MDKGDNELAIITLQQASPSTVQRIVEEVIVGRDPAKKDRVHISAQDGSNLFVVRAARLGQKMLRPRRWNSVVVFVPAARRFLGYRN